MSREGLDAIFSPTSIAVIGASRHRAKIGYAVLRNLIVNEYQGTLYPVNPKATSIHGIRTYPSVLAIPDPVDLAIITVPAEVALAAVEECGKKGVPGLVVITAGFREVGGAGIEREERLLALCRQYRMTMIGPNCMGVINTDPEVRMDATFAPTPPLRGDISLVSQSGALGIAILDHAKSLGIGFAKFCSLGNKAQVSLNDLLAMWHGDGQTKTILAYIENFGNPVNFVRIARDVTKHKPIIAVKSGRSEAGSRAAVSHTGSLGGSDLAAEAVFNQTGVLRANSIEELFDDAMAFSLQPLPDGTRVAIVSDAGGPAIMCVDELVAQGLRLAELDAGTVEFMRTWAPPEASLRNPIDLTPQASLDDYRRALDAVLRDDAVDAAIAIYVPPIRVDEVEVARAIWQTASQHGKPVLCNFLGRTEESPGFVELVKHSVPSYLFPESAARALGAMYRYAKYRAREEGETRTFPVDRRRAAGLLRHAQDEGRTRLRDAEALDVLDAYGIRIARSRFVADVDALPAAAKDIGYPVVLKATGPGLVHKTDLRAVILDVRTQKDLLDAATQLRDRLREAGTAFDGYVVQEFVRGGKEVILGMTRDKVYGPFLVFGLGGIYVEYLKDVAFGLPPLTDRDARRMIESIRTYPLLEGVRGEPPSDVDALVDAVLRLSQLVLDFESIQEIDLNPVVALRKGDGYRAVDARIVLGSDAKPPHPPGPDEGAQSSIHIPSGSTT
ncbi:MAG TPA: acetate--CoA ligase family protein [Thermoplasmata archaeon]|nr:acetate--CoA ligase family protein [Thermoplasmata archaeon]